MNSFKDTGGEHSYNVPLNKQQTPSNCPSMSPFRQDQTNHRKRREVLGSKNQSPSLYQSFGRPGFLNEDEEEKKSDTSLADSFIRQPLHLEEDEGVHYYRVIYRGVVALLSEPDQGAPRSGCYLSYGEVIQSKRQIPLQDENDVTAIRVDQVLTGGYAYDPSSNSNSACEDISDTPKRSNVASAYTTTTTTMCTANSHLTTPPQSTCSHDGLPIAAPQTPRCEEGGITHQGYVFSHNRKQQPILERLLRPPQCEHGRFFYKIVSATPLPILSGPSMDAPVSKAMVLPGTVHEVSFRMHLSAVSDAAGIRFLRLAKRKGYIASQRIGAGRRRRSEPLVKDVTDEITNPAASTSQEENNVSVLSVLSTSIPSSTARHPRRRHRPPRRIRETNPRLTRPKQDFLNLSTQSHSSDRLQTPSSNVSLLSDESSLMEHHLPNNSLDRGALSPDRSVARSNHSSVQPTAPPTFFLMRVTAPRGLRILDAPHFQVNNLIHGTTGATEVFHQTKVTATNPAENTVVFDSVRKTRTLPRGALFEASKRMESSEALFHQGTGLIKLADNSGWVIVPHAEELEKQFLGQTMPPHCRGFEEVGNATVLGSDTHDHSWMRVAARGGVHVVCAPPAPSLEESSSGSSSPANSASSASEQLALGKSDSASDVASSVGSSFLDAMFRGPKRNDVKDDKKGAVEKPILPSTTIPCGICIQVESQIPPGHPQHRSVPQEYSRLRGGQGWIPLYLNGKPSCVVCPRRNPPKSRFGSFWFRVESKRGIKVRLGPSTRAPSIKSNDGVYFRFECGEFLRASEVITVHHEDSQGHMVTESFAKLYRNRHLRLNEKQPSADYQRLECYTTQAEWVQIQDGKSEHFLRECDAAPRIERHKQGWRYKVVTMAGISIKKGPSFDAEDTGMHIAEGESVAIIERVTCPDENGVTWLRLKEGQGWLHDMDPATVEKLIIPHSFRHRTKSTNTRPTKPNRHPAPVEDKNHKIAYNTIIARLFHNDLPGDNMPGSPSCRPDASAK